MYCIFYLASLVFPLVEKKAELGKKLEESVEYPV